jgi:hypothetical protein
MTDKITIEVSKDDLALITFGLFKASQHYNEQADRAHGMGAEFARIQKLLDVSNAADELRGALKKIGA